MIKKLPLAFVAVIVALSSLGVSELSAQAPFGGPGPKSNEPLQMVLDYGTGQPKHLESHHGVIEPAAVAVGQTVGITLQFLRKNAGQVITVVPLDGGLTDLHGSVAVSSDGSVVFRFQSGAAPGLYRLAIIGERRYEIPFYAVDPNRPPPSRPARH